MKKPPAKRPSTPANTPPQASSVTTSAYWQGPLPPPAALRSFEDVVPGLAERIVVAWETESAHRREIEKTDQKGFYRDLFTGKLFALFFILSAMILAGVFAYVGAPWLGAIFGAGTIGAVVWAFIRSQQRNK